ncbi:MAG: cysteine desulfurase [Lachnospiraceae bacterium]|nr:cysteine desulfurase [Lachnospiraceae bacterium]
MQCYLDNAATTRPFAEVRDIMMKTLDFDFGNPSSKHAMGMEAEEYVEAAREKIAKTLKVSAGNIVFTSGGTESNNQALIGSALAQSRKGKHLITTCFEHASVYNPMEFLRSRGYEITYLPVDSLGHVDPQVLKDSIRKDTILVSCMIVNNEIGSILDVAELSKAAKEVNPDIIFHVDAIQGYGKVPIYPKKMGIDMLSVSGHKIHGPKGSGFLYIGDGVRNLPIIYGGEQQKNRRSGTENVPAIAGLGAAVDIYFKDHADHIEKMYANKERFIRELDEKIEGATVNAIDRSIPLSEAVRKTAPHIVSVSFEGIKAEVLLHALEDEEIYVSSGSACSSNHPGISGALKAIGVKKELLDSTIRFSFGLFTEGEEIDKAIDALEKLLPIYRKYTRK